MPFLVPASTLAPDVDRLAFGLLFFCGLVAAALFGLIIFFVIRYHKDRHPVARPSGRSWPWEVAWAVSFLAAGLVFFAWGARIYVSEHTAPPGATEIYGVGKQWMWKFQHSTGRQELDELHVPLGQPIRLVLISEDVVHSFYVPAFRIKQDVIPGRYTETTFSATRPGEYLLLCAQYCGTSHARMTGKVVVLPPEQYAAWLNGGTGSDRAYSEVKLSDRGARQFTRYGCVSCHGEGSSVPAPELAGLFGSAVNLQSGEVVRADENYLRESITEPNAKLVRGYSAIMPSYRNQIPETDLNELVAYIKSLPRRTTQP